MSDEPAQSGVGAATGEGTTEPAQMPPEGQDTGEEPAPEQVIAEEYIRLADEALRLTLKAGSLDVALTFVRAGAPIAPTHREAAPTPHRRLRAPRSPPTHLRSYPTGLDPFEESGSWCLISRDLRSEP